MKSFTKFTLRLTIYLVVLAYLAADLMLFDGPISQRFKPFGPDSEETAEIKKAGGAVARVYGHIITRSQLNRAIHERLLFESKHLSKLTRNEKKMVEYAALGELIDHELIRVKVKYNTKKLEVSEEEINARFELFSKKFSTVSEFKEALESQGLGSMESFRNRLAARIQQEKYVAMRVDPLVVVSEEEIKEFYETHQEKIAVPERIRARHIFISVLDMPEEEAKQKLQNDLTEIRNGANPFEGLALSRSMDPATKNQGGDLGWMSRNRIPADFADAVFALEKNQPTYIKTKIGYHIVEVTDRLPAETPSMESIREDIHAAIATVKRHQAVIDFRTALREFEKDKIEIFHDRLAK